MNSCERAAWCCLLWLACERLRVGPQLRQPGDVEFFRGAEEELQVGQKQIHEVLPYSASIRPLTSWPGTRGQEIGNLPATVAAIASLKGIRVVGNPAR